MGRTFLKLSFWFSLTTFLGSRLTLHQSHMLAAVSSTASDQRNCLAIFDTMTSNQPSEYRANDESMDAWKESSVVSAVPKSDTAAVTRKPSPDPRVGGRGMEVHSAQTHGTTKATSRPSFQRLQFFTPEQPQSTSRPRQNAALSTALASLELTRLQL